jgi:ATP-binding cassette subfamily B protein
MGMFSNLDQEAYDRQYTDRQLVKRMGNYLKPYTPRIILITVLVLLNSLTGAILPIIVSRGIDLIQGNPTSSTIFYLFITILVVGVAGWFFNWIRRRITVRTVSDTELQLRLDAFRASVQHDLSFYDEFPSGKIVSRITSDTKEFSQIVVLITDLFSQIVQSVILGIVLIRIDLTLSLYLFAFLPLVFLFSIAFRRIARTVTRQGMRAMANVNSTIKETISGIAVAKNFRQETSIFQDFDEANTQSYHVNIKRGLVLATVFPTLNAIGGVGSAFLVYTGGLSVAQGLVTSGAWFLFLQSLDQFFFPILNLSAFWANIQSGLSAAERAFALIDAESSVRQEDNQPSQELKGEIVFENVSFRYTERQGILDNFNLHIQPGETIALVGHTGAGKSSIAKLIARFYEFQEGRVLIDGQDIRSLDLESYRSQLGIVSQIPFLFSGTVAENICYACRGDRQTEDIHELALQIGNGEWLNALPKGLQTEVGERGAHLSMGQRQLVSLLRVLVQRPAIFILDEATASIDPFTEWQIQQALNLILECSTSILIAHRLSTVKAADRIIVLEKGKIIEEGNHQSLLEQGGHYASLYNTYFRHQSLDYKPEGLVDFLEDRKAYQIQERS